jgi:hypothetical protein
MNIRLSPSDDRAERRLAQKRASRLRMQNADGPALQRSRDLGRARQQKLRDSDTAYRTFDRLYSQAYRLEVRREKKKAEVRNQTKAEISRIMNKLFKS